MKTKTIAAYRLTTNHKLILRDLDDGVRKTFEILRVENRPKNTSGKPVFIVWFRDGFGSEASVIWRPLDRVEILA